MIKPIIPFRKIAVKKLTEQVGDYRDPGLNISSDWSILHHGLENRQAAESFFIDAVHNFNRPLDTSANPTL